VPVHLEKRKTGVKAVMTKAKGTGGYGREMEQDVCKMGRDPDKCEKVKNNEIS